MSKQKHLTYIKLMIDVLTTKVMVNYEILNTTNSVLRSRHTHKMSQLVYRRCVVLVGGSLVLVPGSAM